jgi:hypothetical protein
MKYRTQPICPKCGERIKGIYRDESKIPDMFKTIGDTFIRWDWEGHKCSLLRRIFKPKQ